MKNEGARLKFSWVKEQGQINDLAAFFVKNIDTSYISHTEVIDGKAIDLENWAPDLASFMSQEFGLCLSLPKSNGRHYRLAKLEYRGKTAGVAFLDADPSSEIAILQDMVVDIEMRGRNFGAAFLRWIETELRALGIKQFFLESGIHNTDAQDFFVEQGFKKSSVVMCKNFEEIVVEESSANNILGIAVIGFVFLLILLGFFLSM